MPTLEERMARLEQILSELLDAVVDDVEDIPTGPDPDDYETNIGQIRIMTHLPYDFIVPDDVPIDHAPGVAEAQRTAVAFLAEEDRENPNDLTEGEYWWCIFRGYSVLIAMPENRVKVGADPSGLRTAIYKYQFLLPIKEICRNLAHYNDGLRAPRVSVPDGPIDWDNLPYSWAGGK